MSASFSAFRALQRGAFRLLKVLVVLGIAMPLAGSASAAVDGLPTGFHDAFEGIVESARCRAYGWAADPDDLARDLQVRILSDEVQVATTTAKLYRPDLLAGCTDGTCAFEVKLWGKISPGVAHSIRVQAYDTETMAWVDLESTPKSLTCWGYPVGFHDGEAGAVSASNCAAFGWAADPDNRSRDLRVRLLSDGRLVASTTANLLRPDVKACTGGTCGWYANLSGLVAPDKSHLISAQAFDKETGLWRSLSATPKSLSCLSPLSLSKTFTSAALKDGWIMESAENSEVGGSLDSGATTVLVGDAAGNEQYRMLLSFKTSGLPDGAKILAAQLRLTRESVAGSGNPFDLLGGLLVDIRRGYFGPAASLEVGDFSAKPDKGGLGPFKPTLVGGMYTVGLPSASFAYINTTTARAGLTQLRLRFKLDDNNDLLENYMSFYSGNVEALKFAPKLIVTYQAP